MVVLLSVAAAGASSTVGSRLAVKRGDFIPVEQVRADWTNLVGQATSLLRRKFENELPPILSGLDATGIQEECRKAIDEVLSILHQGGESA